MNHKSFSRNLKNITNLPKYTLVKFSCTTGWQKYADIVDRVQVEVLQSLRYLIKIYQCLGYIGMAKVLESTGQLGGGEERRDIE